MHRNFASVILLTLAGGCIFPHYAKGVVFEKEHIAVTIVAPLQIEVRGEYFFISGDGDTGFSTLFYPFPLDSSSLYPCSIRVTSTGETDSISFTKDDRGILFPVNAYPEDTTEILVVYRQQVKKRRGTYILTTTGAWGRPLHNSTYSICVPQALTLNYMSYESDSVFVKGNNVVYSFFRSRFMPDRDLFFTWSVK